jgi:hypothetical protein
MEEEKDQIHKMAKQSMLKRFKVVPVVITIVLLVVVYSISVAVFHGVKAADYVHSSWQRTQVLMVDIKEQNWLQSADSIDLIAEDLKNINTELDKLGPLSKLPKINKDIRVARQFVSIVSNLSDSYGQAFRLVGNTQHDLFETNPSSNEKDLLKTIGESQETLFSIEDSIDMAREQYEDINVDDFSGFFSKSIVKSHYLLGQLIESTDLVLPVASIFADLLGYDEERNYLLVFQNNMELRPTGGFIGSYGIVTIKDAEIINIFTDDIYNLDKLSEGKMKRLAPPEMLKYNKQKYWYMRDANWYANYPDSAINIIDFFNEERVHAGLPVQKIDGVIALTPEFIANILDVIGPIESHGVTFSGNNFAIDLERFVEFDYVNFGIPVDQRKDIIGLISAELISRVEAMVTSKPLELWLAFKKNIDEKHILVYMFEERLQKYFLDHNWAGELKDVDSDYLMVVDSNFASLKTDSVIERSIDHSVTVDEGGNLIARLEFTYHHTGDFVRDLVTRYRTYARVYVPMGSWFERGWTRQGDQDTPIDLSVDLDYGKEYGKTYASYFVVTEPGESQTVILEYRLPDYIKDQYNNGSYDLLIQKQPGTSGHKLQIDLRFGQGISAYNSPSIPVSFRGDEIGWESDLSVDRIYKLKFID